MDPRVVTDRKFATLYGRQARNPGQRPSSVGLTSYGVVPSVAVCQVHTTSSVYMPRINSK